MKRRVIVGSLVVLAFAAGAVLTGLLASRVLTGSRSSGPRDDPAAFVSHVVALIVADDYSAAWGSLNRAHQRVAPRSEYVACELMTPVDATLRSIDVVRVQDRSIRVPGASETVSGKAVTLRIKVVSKTFKTPETLNHTFNAVADGSRWTWILTPHRYAIYRDDACGA